MEAVLFVEPAAHQKHAAQGPVQVLFVAPAAPQTPAGHMYRVALVEPAGQ
jgi:hypothetical protein